MMKNIVFDIGNVIYNFNIKKVIKDYSDDVNIQKFILNNIINSPEWLGYSMLDQGYVKKDDAIGMIQDRTNHIYDDVVDEFLNNYQEYGFVDIRFLELIKKLKNNGYKVYLLSNMNEYTRKAIDKTELLDIVDGYVFSYLEHQIKPYNAIYNTLINRYSINPSESLFLDDVQKNINTSISLGFNGYTVEPDNFESVLLGLNEYDINY